MIAYHLHNRVLFVLLVGFDNVCCQNEHVFRSIFPLKRLHMKSRRLNGMRHMFNDNV